MKRIHVGKPTKLMGASATVLALVGMSLIAGPAANAAESTVVLYPVYENPPENCYEPGGQPVLVGGDINEIEGEDISNILVEGSPLPGDAEYRLPAGTYDYTYDVTTTATGTVENLGGSFTIVECTDPEPADPSATLGPVSGTANDDGTTRSISVSGSVTLADIPEGATVTIVTTASSGATSTTTVSASGPFSTTLTGTFPDGTVTVSSQTYVNGAPVGSPSGTSVVFTPAVDPQPEAPIVDGHLTGVLEDNKSAVHAVVTVDRGDAEGTLVVVISHGDSEEPDATLEYPEGTETLRVTFPVDECGSLTFSIRFQDSLNSGQEKVVEVPCPVTSGGNNGGNNGGSTGGGDSNGSTGGTGGQQPTDTTKATSGDYQTDDVYFASSENVAGVNTATLGYGVLLAAAGLMGFAVFFGLRARTPRPGRSIQG